MLESRCKAAREYGRPFILLHQSIVANANFNLLQLKLSVKFRAPILPVGYVRPVYELITT
jgi:hypothetical protein